MDSNFLPIPRLRLSRNPHYTHSDPVVGPSRLPGGAATNLSGVEEHEDTDGSTPKLMSKLLLNSQDYSADTPAARLRALMSSTSSKFPQSTPPPPPKSPSLLDSDLETPHIVGRDKSSVADVKQIFSFALREPGDTPQKTRARRNSIDGSEVDGSPMKSRDKGKRKSLSDEEVDNVSLRSSLATTTFNNLREKLEKSRSQLKNMPLSKILDLDNNSQDTASLLRELNQATPPMATSTPQRSMQMPLFSSQSSNLLEHDSEMNRMMEAIEDSVPFPTGDRSETPVDLTARRHSVPISPLHKSSHSTSRRVSDNDKLREREREWNKPQPPRPPTPDLKHRHSRGSFSSRSNSPTLSPGWSPVRRTLSRKSSAASIQSQDDDFSSRASSVMSQADYRERVSLEERERGIEREREWNKPHHRSSSSMDVHSPSRPRTQSSGGLLRSTSSLSFYSLDRQNKRHSISSASSNDSHNRSIEDLGEEDPVHQRERNWNAPRPRWSHGQTLSLTSRRSLSPLPPDGGTPPGSPTTRQKELLSERPRTPVGDPPSAASHLPLAASSRGSDRPISPLPGIRKGASIPTSSPSRSTLRNRENQVSSTSQGNTGRRSLPQPSRAHAGRVGSPTPSNLRPSTSAPGQSSRIPTRTSKQSVPASPASAVSRRSPSPERLVAQALGESSELHIAASNYSLEESSTSHEATPSMRNLTLPDEATVKNSLSGPTTIQELSPPPTPSSEEPDAEPLQASVLSTPPRRSSFSASRIEFQTPSPPKGLPDLPGPPPSSEDDTGTAETYPRPQSQSGPNFSMMKTPKPPGGWADTPGPRRPILLQRTASLEQPLPAQEGSGLVTPGPSLSRASTMPLQTPVPPGGWMATPAPRKSILKVRFDPQPNTLTASSQEDTSAPQSQNGHPVRSPLTPPAEADEQVAKSKDHSDITHRGPDSSKGLKRLPSIRMLDAYGRETKPEPDEPQIKQEDVANISSIKILNAMGREIEDQGDLSVMSTDDSTILDHNEALTRVRLGLNDLAHDMSDIDRSHDQIALDQTRLKELDTMSQAARETREKLSQTLRMARNSQEELRNKIAPLRASMRRSQLFTYDVSPNRGHWNGWFFWTMLFAQVILILAMYRVSLNRAKDIFMSTYYDPFEPDLHLYAIRPGTYDLLSSPHTWSILAIKDFVYRRGLKSAFAELWMICLDTLATWQKRTWVLWGEDTPSKWPPM